MYSLHEALARDRMRERRRESRQSAVARALASERRWHRKLHHAQLVHDRRAGRVGRLSSVD